MDGPTLDKRPGPDRKRETGNRDWDNWAGAEIEVGRLQRDTWNDQVPRSFRIENDKTALVHTSAGADNNRFSVERVPIEKLRTQLENVRQSAQRELDEAQKNMVLIEQALAQLPSQEKQAE